MSALPKSSLALKPLLRAAAQAAASAKAKGPADGFEARAQAAFTPLHRGSMGPAVRAVQARLLSRGFLKAADLAQGRGVYGPRTEAAVCHLQRAHGLEVTGIVDRATHTALLARAAPADSFAAAEPARAPHPLEDSAEEVTATMTMPLERPKTR